ncbi:restriction endonuclease subunit S [Streptomyces sp. UMAF16]|nr:restriction endonuclease subunit S [Streptomyces sp. UMAF16]
MRGELIGSRHARCGAGWTTIALGEAGTWLSGGTPSTGNDAFWGGEIPWISGASMKNFRIVDSDRRVTELGARQGSRLVEQGAVLFVVRGMSLKSEFRVGVTQRRVAFGQDCKAIVPGDGIDATYLALAIQARTAHILTLVEETSHGTGRLDTARLQQLRIPLPPLREQQRIVAAYAAFERRIGALERVQLKTQVTERSWSMTGLTEAWKTETVLLGECLAELSTGWSPVCEPRQPGADEWGVLKLSAVTSGRFVADEAKALPSAVGARPALEIRPGDVLMARANGVKDLVGVACVVREVRRKLMLPDLMFRLTADSAVLQPEFLGLVLTSSEVRRQINDAMRGSSGQHKISQRDVRDLLIPRVALREQHRVIAGKREFERRLNALAGQVAKLRTIQLAVVEDLLADRVELLPPERAYASLG